MDNSPGAGKEHARAKRLDKTIYYKLEEVPEADKSADIYRVSFSTPYLGNYILLRELTALANKTVEKINTEYRRQKAEEARRKKLAGWRIIPRATYP